MASSHNTYTIHGVKVQFPCKPYPSQFSMMDKIIKGLEKHQNCLLESPTGSGKSLALLCSVLAWQQAEKEKSQNDEEEESKSEKKGCTCDCKIPLDLNTRPKPILAEALDKYEPQAEDEDDDFKPLNKIIKTAGGNTVQGSPSGTLGLRTHLKISYDQCIGIDDPPNDGHSSHSKSPSCSCQEDVEKKPKRRIPKIFFGTRTHKQITQITHELKRTAYKNVRMTVLASREHTCIDKHVSKATNKNEECKKKLDGAGCSYRDGVKRHISHSQLERNGLYDAWDLEDFTGFCRKKKCCPYFGIRALMDTADIVFCPYNYLIDPMIREAMAISTKNQIIIIDEAHNIEDSARDAGSLTISKQELSAAAEDLQLMFGRGQKIVECEAWRDIFLNMIADIELNEEHVQGYDTASKIWIGMDIVAKLEFAGAAIERYSDLQSYLASLLEREEKDGKEGEDELQLHSKTLVAMEGVFMIMKRLLTNNMKFVPDYRLAMIRKRTYEALSTNKKWIRRGRAPKAEVDNYTLHFWCMNPAVAFSDLGDNVRSIVLTSGTLSPMDSFQSELGSPFPIQLEASHVIGKDQVWVGAISTGPKGTSLLGSYQHVQTFQYQDDVGRLVYQVCQIVPHGVLCFVSSYHMMKTLTDRWKQTGMWNDIHQHKVVLLEPRGGDKEEFENIMTRFYEVIEDSENAKDEQSGLTGALFIAVCRGKVSEGLDFTNNNARAVIAVGIPFPSIKDPQVELKKNYNDQHTASRGLLPGRAWYEIQAFRAINQALGRCIRHRYDWGALILVDERYAKNPNKYVKGLSKWVRQRIQYYTSFQSAQNSLESYTRDRLSKDVMNDTAMLVSQSSMSVSKFDDSISETKSVTEDQLDPPQDDFPKYSVHSSHTIIKPLEERDNDGYSHPPRPSDSIMPPPSINLSVADYEEKNETESAQELTMSAFNPQAASTQKDHLDISQFNPAVTSTQINAKTKSPGGRNSSKMNNRNNQTPITHSASSKSISKKLGKHGFVPKIERKDNEQKMKQNSATTVNPDKTMLLPLEPVDGLNPKLKIEQDTKEANTICSSSPPLFDDDIIGDNEIMNEYSSLVDIELNQLKHNSVKPLFKTVNNNCSDGICDKNLTPIKFSPSLQSEPKSSVSTTSPITDQHSESATLSSKRSKLARKRKEFGQASLRRNLLAEATKDTKGDKRNYPIEDGEELALNTRRSNSSKRKRRKSSASTPADLNEKKTRSDSTHNTLTPSDSKLCTSSIGCRDCGAVFYTSSSGVTTEPCPEFIKRLPNHQLERTCIVATESSVANMTGYDNSQGSLLNSYFNEEELCCVKYLCCAACEGSKKTICLDNSQGIVAGQIMAVEGQTGILKTGQVWFTNSAKRMFAEKLLLNQSDSAH